MRDEIAIGASGVQLFPLENIERSQVGYAITADGTSLCTSQSGSWQPSWIVIGCDTACGDPLILDTSRPELPILHDFNGQGQWDPFVVAISVEALASAMVELARVAKGRETPAEYESNPLTDSEKSKFLLKISDLNGGRADLEFWRGLVG